VIFSRAFSVLLRGCAEAVLQTHRVKKKEKNIYTKQECETNFQYTFIINYYG